MTPGGIRAVPGTATSHEPPQRWQFQEPRLVPGDTKFIKIEQKASYSCSRSWPSWIMTSRQVCEDRTLVFDRVLTYSPSMHKTCYILANYRILCHLFFCKKVLHPFDMIILGIQIILNFHCSHSSHPQIPWIYYFIRRTWRTFLYSIFQYITTYWFSKDKWKVLVVLQYVCTYLQHSVRFSS